MNIEYYKNIALDFLKDREIESYAAFLTGSVVDGKNNKESDIDLVIISHLQEYNHTEIFMFRGEKIQIVTFPLSKLNEILWMDYQKGTGIYIGMISKSIPLLDNFGLLHRIVPIYKNIYNSGPPPTSLGTLVSQRQSLINSSSDLRSTALFEDALLMIFEFIDSLYKFILLRNRLWCSYGKSMQRIVKIHFPEIYEQLNNAVFVSIESRDISPLNLFIQEYLDNNLLKESSWITTTQFGLIENVKPYFVIQIADSGSDLQKSAMQILQSQAEKQFDCISLPILSSFLGNEYGEDTLFIAFYPIKQKISGSNITSWLLSKIEENGWTPGKEISFPINLDLELVIFNDPEIITKTIYVIHGFLELFQFTKQTRSNSIKLSFIFFHLLKVLFPEDYKSILYCCFDAWFPASYDTGRVWGGRQLVLAKEKTLKVFSEKFESLKPIIKNINFDEYLKTLGHCRLYMEEIIAYILKNKKQSDFDSLPGHSFVRECKINPCVLTWILNLSNLLLSSLLIEQKNKSFIPYCLINL